jgi:hypothetical protein
MKLTPPAHTVPLQMSDGSMNPLWYAFFVKLGSRGLLDFPDVDNSTPVTNGEVLVWDDDVKKFKPGAN